MIQSFFVQIGWVALIYFKIEEGDYFNRNDTRYFVIYAWVEFSVLAMKDAWYSLC